MIVDCRCYVNHFLNWEMSNVERPRMFPYDLPMRRLWEGDANTVLVMGSLEDLNGDPEDFWAVAECSILSSDFWALLAASAASGAANMYDFNLHQADQDEYLDLNLNSGCSKNVYETWPKGISIFQGYVSCFGFLILSDRSQDLASETHSVAQFTQR